MNSEDNNNSQRLTGFRACIPFYILYDLDLNAQHLRLYGQIEQMESNPNPAVTPSFSYKWMAGELGINRRNTIDVAQKLVKKGYLEHVEISPGKWVWRTKKCSIETPKDNDSEGSTPPPSSVPQGHGGVSYRDTEGVSLGDTQRSHKLRSNKLTNKIYPREEAEIVAAKEKKFSLADMIKDNPHQIPEEMIEDWLQVRKTKKAVITQTSWKRINNSLEKIYAELQITPNEAFERMVASGWQSLELKYFSNDSSKYKPAPVKYSLISECNKESRRIIECQK